MRKTLIVSLLLPLLFSCSSHKTSLPPTEQDIKDTNGFNILMSQFANNIEEIWGLREVLIAGPKDYVKYTDGYQTRSHINFDNGTITIETLANTNVQQHLQQAIVDTLLMGDDPDSIDLYSDTSNGISQMPFLYGQIVDNQGQPIRWQWRASHFAQYLLASQLKKRVSGDHIIWYVTLHLVANHVDKRAQKYLPYIRQAASRYAVDQSLILAIMQIESSFNPYAVSHADALGLMQVVRHTAGLDVFKSHGKSGMPSQSYLLDPANNIDTGTAYLSLLQNTYLAGITNPISRRYAVITAYNGGAGSVLRIFSANKDKAFAVINRLSPDEVFQTLTNKHPAVESRNYLTKVNNALLQYQRRGN